MILTQEQWRSLQSRHHARVQPWIQPRLARRRLGRVHPVDDFLFDYYPYSPARLATWHPGHGVILQGDTTPFDTRPDYRPVTGEPARSEGGVTVDVNAIGDRRSRLELVLRLLTGTRQRPGTLNCFGLHEWAMVYRLDPHRIRHADQPLRLAPAAIDAAVEELGLRCSHIDAYRFFTPKARPRNAVIPTRDSQPELEQPGCLHAGMDLYKYAMWFQPYVGSDLAADCFALARDARALDMAASPYDLSAFDIEPVKVETAPGRAHYVAEQRSLMQQAQSLRSRLIDTFTEIRARL
ncbi:MAG: 3-methyladenine DNA glycosylase, partial [Actinomycetales bacterium]